MLINSQCIPVCSAPHRASWEYHSRAGDAGSSLFLSALSLLSGTGSPEEQMRCANKSTGCILTHLGQWRTGAYNP